MSKSKYDNRFAAEVAQYRQSHSLNQTASHFGIPLTSVKNLCHRKGIANANRIYKYNALNKEDVLTLNNTMSISRSETQEVIPVPMKLFMKLLESYMSTR